MKKLSISIILVFILLLTGCLGNKTQSQNKSNQGNSNTNIQNSDTSKKIFTLDELKKYDGKNGNPAYVAVDGTVYDVTNAKKWKDGMHQGHTAGIDMTNTINSSPHGKSVLKDMPIVGKLK